MKTLIMLLLGFFHSSPLFAENLKPSEYVTLLGPWASLSQSLNQIYCSQGAAGIRHLPSSTKLSSGEYVNIEIRSVSRLITPPDPQADPYFKDETTITALKSDGMQGITLSFNGSECLPYRVSLSNRSSTAMIVSNIWEKQNDQIVDINHPEPAPLEAVSDNDCNANSQSKQIKILSQQSKKIIAAIIDDGVDYNHPDLSAKIPRDDLGYDFDGNTAFPYPPLEDVTKNERSTHGTHIAGIVAKNNPTVQIMALKANTFFNAKGVAAAIEYASKKSVRVLNLSFGSENSNHFELVNEAIKSHPEMIFVIAAGNGGSLEDKNQRNNDEANFQVSPNPLPNVIHVAAVDSQGKLADFSRYGKNTVEVAAPGVDINSAQSGGGRLRMSGTSMAAPQVTRIVSLVLAANPELKPAEVKEILQASVTKKPELEDKLIWGGAVDERKAISLAKASLKKTK